MCHCNLKQLAIAIVKPKQGVYQQLSMFSSHNTGTQKYLLRSKNQGNLTRNKNDQYILCQNTLYLILKFCISYSICGRNFFAIFLNYVLFQESIVILTGTNADTRKKNDSHVCHTDVLQQTMHKNIHLLYVFLYRTFLRGYQCVISLTEDKKILIKQY